MDSMEQVSLCILEIAKKIFQLNEELNSQIIFQGKTFLINGKDISIEMNDCQDSFYYFEHPEIEGVIIKKENGNDYVVKAATQYVNFEGKKWAFAKIRIYEENGDILIRGRRTGSFEMSDGDDEDFIKRPDPELSLVLDSMKNSLSQMYGELCRGLKSNNDMSNPQWVKQLKKYNN